MGDSPDLSGNNGEAEAEAPPTAAELEAAGQSALFGADPAPSPSAGPAVATSSQASPQPYRVLARKYRPQTFSELIGQDAMVQTLANGIRRDRLAHAFLMTGVRGVGKTTTARLIAKALNCIGPDGNGGATIDPCGICEPCIAIAEGRHMDVIEMDAASHTGVDDVREIIDAVRYAAVSARYKIYIIDEVHMLSKHAFNALLKTLEEPPAHVKFLFATTEVGKLPITVLSRCQRFDLRRITPAMLADHFAMVCKAEGIHAEAEALAMIAAAAQGSVRDGLSILDQAISHAELEGEGVTAAQTRSMLGLADRSMGMALFNAILAGDAQTLLAQIAAFHHLGVEPQALMRSQLALVHEITVAQVGGQPTARDADPEEVAHIASLAAGLGAGQLHRLWQLLLKGHEEIAAAPDPHLATEMALLRVMHVADQPDPGALLRRLEQAPVAVSAGQEIAAPPAVATEMALADRWQALIASVEQSGIPGSLSTAETMRSWLRVAEIGPALLRYAVVPGFREDPAPALRDALLQITGARWQVEALSGEAASDALPAVREQHESLAAEQRDAIRNAPLVRAALAAFPDAKLIESGETAGQPWSKRA